MLFALRPVLYLQIAPHTVTIRMPRSGAVVTQVAAIAIEQRVSQGRQRHPLQVVRAIGSAAAVLRGTPNVQVISPFAHPRSIVHSFDVGEALLRQLMQQALQHRWIAIAPKVVIHPLGQPEGGFTDVELRALRDMATGAGARPAHVWTGRALSDAEVLAAPNAVAGGAWG